MCIIKMFGLSHFGLYSIINTHLDYVKIKLAYVESLIGLCRDDFGLCIGIKKRTELTVLFVLQNFYHFNTLNVINQSKHLHF